MEYLSDVIFLVLDIIMGGICLSCAFDAYKTKHYVYFGLLIVATVLDVLSAVAIVSRLI